MQINLDDLAIEGKKFHWSVPESCPCCRGRIWRHGYTAKYFHPYNHQLYLLRLRCPDCYKTFTLYPESFHPRFYYPLGFIRNCLFKKNNTIRQFIKKNKITYKSWRRRLRKQIKMILGINYSNNLYTGFNKLLKIKIIPVSRSIGLGF